jgi:hypothetical protein
MLLRTIAAAPRRLRAERARLNPKGVSSLREVVAALPWCWPPAEAAGAAAAGCGGAIAVSRSRFGSIDHLNIPKQELDHAGRKHFAT